MARKKKELKVIVEYTEGYEQRFTQAVLDTFGPKIMRLCMEKAQEEQRLAAVNGDHAEG